MAASIYTSLDVSHPLHLLKEDTWAVGRCGQRIDIGGEYLEITPLGAGCEVGRSCIMVSFKGHSVMFDCGIHPALSGIGALPLFDAVDVQNVDLCLVTHFHLDHCGAVPYFVSKTSFKGRLFMTEPTRAICKLLWQDYARMGRISRKQGIRVGSNAQPVHGTGLHDETGFLGKEALLGSKKQKYSEIYSLLEEGMQKSSLDSINAFYDDAGDAGILFDEEDIEMALEKCECIDFHQEMQHNGIKFTCFGAGHVLGACMFLVEIGGVRILYTGDYSREKDILVPIAEIPPVEVHVLICESTYGIRVHDERKQREQRFLQAIQDIIVSRNGKCLLPVFALGRAQELLFLLEDHWNRHPELHSIPIIYISPMSNKSMAVYETFINLCGDEIKKVCM